MKATQRLFLAAIAAMAATSFAHATQPRDALQQLRNGEWLSYEVPRVDVQGSPCCFSMQGGKVVEKGCQLDERNWGFGTRDDLPRAPALGEPKLRLFLRRAGNGFDRVRAFGDDCPVDTGNARVTMLQGVSGSASLGLLDGGLDGVAKRQRGELLAAIALHDEPGATAMLERRARSVDSEEMRRDASFWLTQARGEPGFRIVRGLLDAERDDDVRRHLVFAISQSDVPAARTELRQLARSHASVEIRSEALFWLAQDADPETEALVQSLLSGPESRQVRHKAVFALSQLPKPRAIPALKALVYGKGPRDLRREALFWLGQVGGDEAFAVFDELLGTRN